jgi:hypothetical protein
MVWYTLKQSSKAMAVKHLLFETILNRIYAKSDGTSHITAKAGMFL